MSTLISLIPDVDVLIALAPEELAAILLKLAHEHKQQSGLIHPQALLSQINGTSGISEGYPQNKRNEAELAFCEAWNWLTVQGLLIPDAGVNGNNGWMRIGRRAADLLDRQSFESYARSVAFPRSLLHPSIVDAVWLDLVRGDLDTAVFKAFKAVEIAVREVGHYDASDIGTALMRKAFDKTNGPLSDQQQPESERERLWLTFLLVRLVLTKILTPTGQ